MKGNCRQEVLRKPFIFRYCEICWIELRNSNILFVVAVLILVWFGTEAFTAQEICATSCISLTGLSVLEVSVAVAVLPVLLVIGGIKARKSENKNFQAKKL